MPCIKILSTYKSVSFALSRRPICDDDCLFDGAIDLKMITERFIRGVVRQAADKYFGERGILLPLHGAVCLAFSWLKTKSRLSF